MAVDENGIEIPDVADNLGRQSVKFIANNKEFDTPEEAQAEIQAMEHSIKSAHDRILAEERQKRAQAEEEDIEWYSTHDKSLWRQYEAKLKGGRGFVGNVISHDHDGEPPKREIDNHPAFDDANAFKKMEDRMRILEIELQTFKQSDDERARIAAVNARESAKNKYPYADLKSVTSEMEKYFLVNNSHPTPEMVLQFMDTINKRGLDLIKTKGIAPSDKPNPPVVVGGGTPGMEGTKRPSLSKDPEGFKKWVTDKMTMSG